MTGPLSDVDAAQLSADVAWNELEQWSGFVSRPSCADGATRVLGKTAVASQCVCSCGPETPAALLKAYENAYGWFMKFANNGQRVSGSMSALATASSPSRSADPAPVAWPLKRSMKSIPNLISDAMRGPSGPYARFDAAADTAALRAFQAADAYLKQYPSSPQHVSDEGATYDLFMRDELPDDVASSIDALQKTWPTL